MVERRNLKNKKNTIERAGKLSFFLSKRIYALDQKKQTVKKLNCFLLLQIFMPSFISLFSSKIIRKLENITKKNAQHLMLMDPHLNIKWS